ncbi:MAG: EAL domain-containing protein [Sulfuricella sp.]|nr:EAL domain-containing protein [Sulfuricella sp.]
MLNEKAPSSAQLALLIENFSRLAQKVLADETLFQTLVVKNADGLLVVEENGVIHYANPAAEKLFHSAHGELLGKTFGFPIREGETSEIEIPRESGKKSGAEMHVAAIEWNGVPAHLLSLRRVEERRQLKETLQKQTDRLRTLVNASPLAIMAVDAQSRVTLWNPAAVRTFGWSQVDVLGQALPSCVAEGADSLEEMAERALQGKVLNGSELVGLRRKDGSELDLQVWTTQLHNAGETVNGVMIFAIDVTERNRAAGIDSLSGLPNRGQFRHRLQQAIERGKHGDHPPFAVLHFGLDRFKAINQSLGHAQGDRVLQETARRLVGALYDTDLVARSGGDEFPILLRDIRHVRDGARIAAKLLDAVAQACAVDAGKIFVTASIGIAIYPQDGTDADSLLHNADAAMQRAKERGGGTSQFYTENLDLRAREQLSLESSLHQALERGEFTLYYQPQVNAKNERIVGVEALLRWFHPEQGEIPPSRFIPVAENSGMIVAIGEWVLHAACTQARAWIAAGLPAVRIAVNISARQLEHPGLVASVAEALASSGLDPKMLELELTESMLVKNAEEVIAVILALKALGVQLSLDDFGTGFSALSYLARLPLDTLKIDRSFVAGIGEGAVNGNISAAIIALARSLKLRVIAEGIETKEQADFLLAHDCDEFQGYFFSHPLPAEECAALLSAGAITKLRLESFSFPSSPAVWRVRRPPELKLEQAGGFS